MRQERAVAMQLATSPRPTSRCGPGPDDRPASRRRNEGGPPPESRGQICQADGYAQVRSTERFAIRRSSPHTEQDHHPAPAPRAARPQPREHGVTLPGSSTAWRPIPSGRRAGQAARTARLACCGRCCSASQLSNRPSSIRAMRRSPIELRQPAERRARAQGLAGSRVAELAPPLHADHRLGPVRT